MQILDTSLQSKSHQIRSMSLNCGGFTLLELIVVMVMIGLVTALAFPNLLKMQASWNRQTELESVLFQISRLGSLARNDRRILKINSEGQNRDIVALPENWHLQSEEDIRWLENGACQGGVIHLRNGDLSWRYKLNAPDCQPILVSE